MRKKLIPSKNRTFSQEFATEVFGVPGRMFPRIYDDANGLFVAQVFKASRPFKAPGYSAGSIITVKVRFDDECKNGHQSFSITGDVREPRASDISMGGCIHEEIAKYFPELAPLIQWHLFDTDGPMHYVANTAYHASNRDHSGHAAGEPSAWQRVIKFGEFPITRNINKDFAEWLAARAEATDNPAWQPVAVAHVKRADTDYNFEPNYTLAGYEVDWYKAPFKTRTEAEQWCEALNSYEFEFLKIPTAYSKGKTRDLDAARRSAVWPDATDEQLCVPRADLEAALLARLPGLVAAFRADMDSAGLLWEDQPAPDAQA